MTVSDALNADNEKLRQDSARIGHPLPHIRTLDEFRIAIAMQLKTHDVFWKDFANDWVSDWRKRKILNALVANHGA